MRCRISLRFKPDSLTISACNFNPAWSASATRCGPSARKRLSFLRNPESVASRDQRLTRGLSRERIMDILVRMGCSQRAGAEAGEDVGAIRGVEVAKARACDARRRGEAAAAQHLVRAEPGLGVLLVRVAHETRVGKELARGPFPDLTGVFEPVQRGKLPFRFRRQ